MLILAAIAVILFIYLVNNYPRLLYTGINISDMGGNKIRLIKRINCMLVSLATGNTGPAWGTSSGGLSFLLRPQHPLLPHRGRVRRGGHGFLLGHDPGPRAVAGRLLPALRPAPSQVRVPCPTTHAEVFGVTRGGRACGGAVAPGSWRSCSLW